MAIKKTGGLGRGLGSILPEIDIDAAKGGAKAATISDIPLDKITPNPYQPRKEFDVEELDELSQSIRQQGVITPITVRRMPDGTYQIIAGERRVRASRMAGLKEIPAYVRVATDTQMMERALIENLQRSDLNAMEVAHSLKSLLEECRYTHDQLSERVGKNRSTITNYLRLLNLPAETQQALSSDKISMAHARALAGVEDLERHLEILNLIIERGLSVHQTEQMVKDNKKPAAKPTPRRGELPKQHSEAQQRLKQRLQSVVEIKRSQRGKGTLMIAFNSDSDFERIMKLLEL